MVKGSEDSYKAGYRIVLFHQVQMPFLDGVINLHTHKYVSKKSLSSVKRTKNNLFFFHEFCGGQILPSICSHEYWGGDKFFRGHFPLTFFLFQAEHGLLILLDFK